MNTDQRAWYCVLYVFLLYYVLIQVTHRPVRPCTYATRGANGCHFQGGEADCPAHAGRAAGHATGPGRAAGRAAGRPIRGSASGQQAGRSVMFCPRCWRVVGVHTVHSARRWCCMFYEVLRCSCIISIQISAPVIVYYTLYCATLRLSGKVHWQKVFTSAGKVCAYVWRLSSSQVLQQKIWR